MKPATQPEICVSVDDVVSFKWNIINESSLEAKEAPSHVGKVHHWVSGDPVVS